MTGPRVKTSHDVLSFWFEDLTRKDWFGKNLAVDEAIREHFTATHFMLASGELKDWRLEPRNWLAAVIVLDQFSRNIYRGTPMAFAADGLALREAKLAIDAGADLLVAPQERAFFYFPFEHSEVLAEQDRAVELFTLLADSEYLDYAERHRAVIREFGRFPHRNAIMGRESTDAELDYLAKPGAGF